MKKILAFICAIAMVFSMATFVSTEANANATETVLATDLPIAAEWNQAEIMTTLWGGELNPAVFVEGGCLKLYVTATPGDLWQVSLALNGTKWAQLDWHVDEASHTYGTIEDNGDGTYVVTFTYEEMVEAYGADDFATTLGAIYLVTNSASEAGITKVTYEVASGEPEPEPTQETVLLTDLEHDAEWQQTEVYTTAWGGDLDLSCMIPGGTLKIYVTTDISQLWQVRLALNGNQWTEMDWHVDPTQVANPIGTMVNNGDGTAVISFAYEDIVSVYGSENLAGTVGAMYICTNGGAAVTINKVTYEVAQSEPEPGSTSENPIIIENLEDIHVSATASDNIYYQWTSDVQGTIVVDTSNIIIDFYNVTSGEVGEYEDDYVTYKIYVEPGDVLRITVIPFMNVEYDFTYELITGYVPGTEQNPIDVDLMEFGIDVEMHNGSMFYTWTPTADATVTLDFTFAYSYNDTVPVVYVDGEEFELSVFDYDGTAISAGAQLDVTAGETIVLEVSTTASVYGTLLANVYVPVMTGDANGDDNVNYLDAMLVAQYYVGDITEADLNVAAADVNGDGNVNYLDAMLIAQYYVGDIDSFNP